MFQQTVVLYALVLISAIFVVTEARCKCEQLKIHYEELGCTPVFTKREDCCPASYNCDNVINPPLKQAGPLTLHSACIFNNKMYADGQKIDDNLVADTCRALCNCAGGRIICAHIDCAEFFGHPPLLKDCFRQYELGKCCSIRTICPPFKNITTCTVDGKTYYEGQQFYPEEDSCSKCVCQKGFDGKFVEPFCKKIRCSFEPNNKELKKNCAPLYFGKQSCCPIGWRCSKDTDDLTNVEESKKNTDKTKTCTYGTKTYNIGEKFVLEEDINCECSVPPLVTCIKKLPV